MREGETVAWRIGYAALGVLLFAAIMFGIVMALAVAVDVARDLGLLDDGR